MFSETNVDLDDLQHKNPTDFLYPKKLIEEPKHANPTQESTGER